jgi:hypothetical protein
MKGMRLYATGNFYGKGITGFKAVKRLSEKQSARSSEASGFDHPKRHQVARTATLNGATCA